MKFLPVSRNEYCQANGTVRLAKRQLHKTGHYQRLWYCINLFKLLFVTKIQVSIFFTVRLNFVLFCIAVSQWSLEVYSQLTPGDPKSSHILPIVQAFFSMKDLFNFSQIFRGHSYIISFKHYWKKMDLQQLCKMLRSIRRDPFSTKKGAISILIISHYWTMQIEVE